MPKHGKRYRANLEKVDREHAYEPAEAVEIIKDFEAAKIIEGTARSMGVDVR